MGVSGLEFLRKQQLSSLRAHILIQLLSQGRLVVLASTRMHQRVLNAGLIGDWLSEQANVRQILYSKFVEEPGPVVVTDDEHAMPKTQTVELSHSRIEQQLKISLPSATVQQMLGALGFDVETVDAGFRCVVPSWRFDISIEQDLIEEIARIYGYNNLPISLPAQALGMASISEAETPLMRLKHYLVDQDIQEVITYSFVDPEIQAILGDGTSGVRLANPIVESR